MGPANAQGGCSVWRLFQLNGEGVQLNVPRWLVPVMQASVRSWLAVRGEDTMSSAHLPLSESLMARQAEECLE